MNNSINCACVVLMSARQQESFFSYEFDLSCVSAGVSLLIDCVQTSARVVVPILRVLGVTS